MDAVKWPAGLRRGGGAVGRLEVGKDGDLALYDGDPFEYTTHCVGTVIEGAVVSRFERGQPVSGPYNPYQKRGR